MALHFITPSPLPVCVVGNVYSFDIDASNAPAPPAPPYTYALAPGSEALPTGLTLDPGTGAISGTVHAPDSAAGTRIILIRVTDATPDTVTKAFFWKLASRHLGAGIEALYSWQFNNVQAAPLASGDPVHPVEETQEPETAAYTLDGNQSITLLTTVRVAGGTGYTPKHGTGALWIDKSQTNDEGIYLPKLSHLCLGAPFYAGPSPGFSFDFWSCFRETPAADPDPEFTARVQLLGYPGPIVLAEIIYSRTQFVAMFRRAGAPVIETGQWPAQWGNGEWHNVRFSVQNSWVGGMTVLLDGTQILFVQDLVGDPDMFTVPAYYSDNVGVALLSSRTIATAERVGFDGLAILPTFQVGDYTPQTVPDYFGCRFPSLPVISYNPEDFVVQRGQVINSQLTAEGGTAPYTFVIETGSSPVAMSKTGLFNGGTDQTGAFRFVVKCIDAAGVEARVAITAVVAPPPASVYTFISDPLGLVPSGSAVVPNDDQNGRPGNFADTSPNQCTITEDRTLGHTNSDHALTLIPTV